MTDVRRIAQIKAWNTAIAILDESELKLRDLIERELVGVAGLSGVRYGEAQGTVDKLMVKVGRLRAAAFKKAFRHVRAAHD